jgi:hypothetical protein
VVTNPVNTVISTDAVLTASKYRLLNLAQLPPYPDEVVAKRAQLEQSPFDGTLVILRSGHTPFQTTPYAIQGVDTSNIPLVNSSKLSDNFLLMRGETDADSVPPFDRFSDAHWAIGLGNVREIAKLAKQGNFKGIAFDPESYDHYNSLFDYRKYDSTTYSFADWQANIRKRGQDFMKAVQEEYPGSLVFLLGGLGMLRNGTQKFHVAADFPTHPYGLLPDFMNGMLDVIAPGMGLVDGCEASYTLYRNTWFTNLRNLVINSGPNLLDPADATKYQNQLEMGMSLYFDATFDQMNDAGYLAHWLASADRPGFFNYQVYSGMTNVTRYLGVYSEHTIWIDRLNIPSGAETAMSDAKTKVSGNLPLGSDIETKIQAAAAAGGLDW